MMVILLLITGAGAATTVKIAGISGELKKNVKAYMASIPKKEYATGPKFQARLQAHLSEALRALGYYQARFTFTVIDKKDRLEVQIAPGPVTKLKMVNVSVTGEALQDADFNRFLKKDTPRPEEDLNHGRYDQLKTGLRNLALRKGYFDADFTDSRLEVMPEKNEAFIHLHFDSGRRYHFGESLISGSQIDEARVRSLQPFKTGDPYSVALMTRYNQNISDTNWFSSVFVEPDLASIGHQGKTLPVKVSLAPQAANQFETGLGYSTDVGPRASFAWKKPWINRLGHSFDTDLSLSQPEQAVTAGYQIPLDDVLRDYYRIQYGMKKIDQRATKSLESNMAVERHWLLESGWHRNIYIRHLMENYTQGELDDTASFLLPGVTYSRSKTRNEMPVMWGDRQSITLEYGDSALISDTRCCVSFAAANGSEARGAITGVFFGWTQRPTLLMISGGCLLHCAFSPAETAASGVMLLNPFRRRMTADLWPAPNI